MDGGRQLAQEAGGEPGPGSGQQEQAGQPGVGWRCSVLRLSGPAGGPTQVATVTPFPGRESEAQPGQ